MIEKIPFFLMLFPIVAIHEFAHAWVAHKLGDDTAKDEGRMNLNPMSHIDLFGTIILPLINISFGALPLGFGKQVPVDHHQLNRPYRDRILVALAGPFANCLLAFAILAVARFAFADQPALFQQALQFASFSVFLGCFNLLPFPRWMDGPSVKRFLNWEKSSNIESDFFGFRSFLFVSTSPLFALFYK